MRNAVSRSLVWCLGLGLVSGLSLSQTPVPQAGEELQRQPPMQPVKPLSELMAENLHRMEESHKKQMELRKIFMDYSDEALQQALGATPEQWKIIQPKLSKVRNAPPPPSIRISPYSYTIGGHFAAGSSGRIPGTGGDGRSFGGDPNGAGANGSPGSPSSQASAKEAPAHASGGYGFGFGGWISDSELYSKPVKKRVGDVCLGWEWGQPLPRETDPDKPGEGLRACKQLLDTLETKNPDPNEIRQRVETLRQIRQQQQAECRQAREELRKVITPEQEAKLILMGYLE